MEDKQGDVVAVTNGGVSESTPLRGNFPCETPVENLGSENRVEVSHEEGDGEEIMEVVGSNVFVDGVIGQNDGEFGPKVVGDLEGQNILEPMHVSTDGEVNEMGQNELELSEHRDEKSSVAVEEVVVSFSESATLEGGAVSASSSQGVGVLDDSVWNPGIEPMAVTSSATTEFVAVQTEEATKTTHVVTSEGKTIKDETVDKDSADSVVDGEVGSAEKEEVLPSRDNAESHDHCGQVVSSEVSVNPKCEGRENVQAGIDSATGIVGSVNGSAGEEVLVTHSLRDGSLEANTEQGSTDFDCDTEAKIVHEKEAFDAESEDQALKSDTKVSVTQDENQGSLNEIHGIDGVSHANPEPILEKSLGGEKEVAADVEFDDIMDFKYEEANISPPNSTYMGNEECLKTDGDLETDVAHQNQVSSNEPTQLADGGDTVEVNKDKSVNTDIQADTEENQPNTMGSSCPGVEGVGEVIDDQKIAISQVVDGDGSCEKEEIDSEMSKGNAENPVFDTSTENMHLSAKSEWSKVETADVKLTEDHDACNNPAIASEVGFDVVVPECDRKAIESLGDGSDKRVNISTAKIPASTSPKPSFKIGECIRRVASQLTGSTSLVKGDDDETVIDGSANINVQPERRSVALSAESFSVNEMLSQLELVAQNPRKAHDFQNNIHTFFLGFRYSIALNRRGRKKKAEQTVGGSGEEFEFDDVNDSYWTDRIVQNYSEGQLLHNGENGSENLQVVPFDAEKSVKPGRKPHSRKRFSTGNYPTEATEYDENVKRKKHESSPAELILNFAERSCVPSEINLNKIFRRFGPLMESETEVDHDSGRAKVIFKRGADAEVAHNSAEKFNIFGPVLVNYQIGYSPVISVKILPVAVPQCPEDATLMI